jgi:hypothetical protein
MFKRSFSKFMINRSNSVDFSRWFITPPPLPDCVYICLNVLSERLNYFLTPGEFNRQFQIIIALFFVLVTLKSFNIEYQQFGIASFV